MTANLLTLNSSKTEFLLIGLKNQLAKIHNSSLDTSHFARNLGFIFDEHLTFADQITALSKACYYHIRQLRCIWPYLDSSTACTIATSIVHSKLDYCNSLYYKLPKSQLSRLQQIQNSLASTLMKAPKSCHTTPILRSLHWLRIAERIEYKLLSLTYKVLTTTPPPYRHKLISTQRPRSTRSSSVVTLAQPPSSSSLKITDRSFHYTSPCLWYQLPLSLRKPHSGTSSSISCSPVPSPITSSSSDSPLCTSITPSLFNSRLKNHLCHKSYPLSFTSSSRTASMDFCLHRFFWATRFLIFIFSLFFVSGPCARLSWPSCQLLSARKSTVSYRIVLYRTCFIGCSDVGITFLCRATTLLIMGKRIEKAKDKTDAQGDEDESLQGCVFRINGRVIVCSFSVHHKWWSEIIM